MTDFTNSDDWRTKFQSLAETLPELRRRALFVDVHFMVGQPPSTRCFSGHKMVLASGSPVFEAMFFGQLAERRDTIPIPDDDPEDFEIMLQYLYGECIVFPSIVAACKSYHLGDKYLIPRLQAKSASFIRASTMDEENFWGIIKCGLLENNIILEAKFHHYIQLNAAKLIKSANFLFVPEHIVTTFLRMETMDVSEYELLSSVTNWCLRFGYNVQSKTRDELFRSHLQYIRFSVLTPKEFCHFTQRFPNVLDASTSLKTLKHLIDPSNNDLPVWLSVNKVVRRPVPPMKLTVRLRSTQNLSTVRPNL